MVDNNKYKTIKHYNNDVLYDFSLNSFVKCVPYHVQLDSSNALEIIDK